MSVIAGSKGFGIPGHVRHHVAVSATVRSTRGLRLRVPRPVARTVAGVRSLRGRVESEHVILAGAYGGAGVLGHDSPMLMAVAYGLVGLVHTFHTASKRKPDATA